MRPKNYSIFSKAISVALLCSFILTNIVAVGAFAPAKDETASDITRFTTDLTQLGRDGRLRENLNLENDTLRLIKVLAGDGRRQPVILDETGENQDLVVEQLAIRIANGSVDNDLSGVSVIKLETATLFSNAKSVSEASGRIESVIDEVLASNNKTILFIEELTNVLAAGNAGSKLIENIQNGKLRIVGGSSQAAYAAKIENTAFAPLFEGILIAGTSYADAKSADAALTEKRSFRGDNVSADLREMMAAESGSKRVDVIIQAKNANDAALRSIMKDGKARVSDRIGTTDTLVANLPLSSLNDLSASGLINYVSPDRPVKSLGHIETTTGTSLMRSQASGYGRSSAYTADGSGVGVAIIDSGIYTEQKSFTDGTASSRVVYSQSFVSGVTSTEDDFGHGTHVASLLAGSASRDSGAYKGIAPKANLINLKVLNGFGFGSTSALLNALNWVLTNKATYNIRVVNISLGAPSIDTWTNDPICLKVQDLNRNGILVVAAAGNNGKNFLTGQKIYGQVHSPGNDPSVLTVGASNTFGTDARSDDAMATYSSHGPTRSFYTEDGVRHYDNVIKPDIVAPGNKIVAAKARSTSTLATLFPGLTDSTLNIAGDDNDMMYLSGTSMSAPMAAGAAALLFQINPKMTPTAVKMVLEYTAQPLNGVNMLEQGAGQLNIEGAVKLARTYKFDKDFNSLKKDAALLQSGTTFPTASSTVAGTTFSWAQGILANHVYITGQNLAAKYQDTYDNWYWFEDGINYNDSGTPSLGSLWSSGNTLYKNVMTSNGTAMGGGSVFVASGVLIGDGVLVGDGVLLGDGVLVSDGVLIGDGVLISDITNAQTVLTNGDNTAAMH